MPSMKFFGVGRRGLPIVASCLALMGIVGCSDITGGTVPPPVEFVSGGDFTIMITQGVVPTYEWEGDPDINALRILVFEINELIDSSGPGDPRPEDIVLEIVGEVLEDGFPGLSVNHALLPEGGRWLTPPDALSGSQKYVVRITLADDTDAWRSFVPIS